MNNLYLGIDCGGSKISCLAVDHSGRLIGTAKTVSDGLLLEEASDLEVYGKVVNEVISSFNGKCSAVFCNTGGFPPSGLSQLLRDLTGSEKDKSHKGDFAFIRDKYFRNPYHKHT